MTGVLSCEDKESDEQWSEGPKADCSLRALNGVQVKVKWSKDSAERKDQS